MNLYMCIRLHFLSVLISSTWSEAPGTLRLVTMIYRHGDRSPTEGYPSDPHQEDAWPQGYGQLTQKGMKQEYGLGRFIRQKYAGFLNDTYKRHEIYVQSSDYDRTLMSAQSVLVGLYPPSGQQLWNEQIQWQPIPVHTIPKEYDTLLRTMHTCYRYKKEQVMISSSPEVKAFNKKHQVLSDFLRDKSGYSNITNITGDDVRHITDTLKCESFHDMAWAPWVNKTIVDTLRKEVHPFTFDMFTKTDLAKRLTGGLFVGKTIEKMKLKRDGLLDPRYKLSMYSAHDSNIATILGSMNLYNMMEIPYSTALMFELHTNTDNSSFVQMWLRNDTELQPYKLTLPGCVPECPLDKFINLTSKIVPTNWFYECLDEDSIRFLPLSNVLLLSIGGGVLGFILIMLLIAACCHRKNNRRKHVSTYGKIRAETIPEEMPMMLNSANGGLSDEEL